MKYLGKITDDKDLVTKEYVDNAVSGGGSSGVTGVKGNAESSYRTGQVNLTPANIGAVPTTRTVNGKALSSNITLSASDIGLSTSTQTLTVASGFKLYSSTVPITLYSYGKFIYLHGEVSPSSAITGSTTEYTICTVPTGYRPQYRVLSVCQGSGNYKWLACVNTNGTVTFARYHSPAQAANAYANAATTVWLAFDLSWIIT